MIHSKITIAILNLESIPKKDRNIDPYLKKIFI